MDNDFFFLSFMEGYFREKGMNVTLAYDGKEAIEKLSKQEFHLAIVDMFIPKIIGKDVLNFINRKVKRSIVSGNVNINIPITILTSSSLIEQFDEIESLEADYYIPKAPSDQMKELFDSLLAQLKSGAIGREHLQIERLEIFPREASLDLLEEIRFLHDLFDSVPLGLIILDTDSKVIRVNREALTILKKGKEDLLGQGVQTLFGEGSISGLKRALEESLSSEGAYVELRPSEKGGPYIAIVSKFLWGNEVRGWIVAIVP
ncbi:MAG: response regulator [Desulfatiglandales bacterium]